jgi:hypothetical protein
LDCRLAMSRACVQTTGRRIRISRHDGASARCSVSNRPDPPSVSCPFTPPSTTHSTSSAISPPATRFASSETKRSGRGEPPPPPEVSAFSKRRAAPIQVGLTTRQRAFQTPHRADPSWCDSARAAATRKARSAAQPASGRRRSGEMTPNAISPSAVRPARHDHARTVPHSRRRAVRRQRPCGRVTSRP